MADRVSVTICIGGALARADILDFMAAIEAEGLTDQLGGTFRLADLAVAAPLELAANDVTGGQLDLVEAFCVAHRLAFRRWCGAYPGGWEAERLVFDGRTEPRSYTVTDNDSVVVTEGEVQSLGSFDAITAYFRSANPPMPAFTIVDDAGADHD